MDALAGHFQTLESKVHFILLGRNQEMLERISADLRAKSPLISIVTVITGDLSQIDEIRRVKQGLGDAFLPVRSYSGYYLFNNAGMLGKLGSVKDVDVVDYASTLSVNVLAAQVLTSTFLQFVQQLPVSERHNRPAFIVSTSSLLAIQPLSCWGVYSSSKAALDMFHGCLREELREALEDNVWVLNYAPGPLDTDMMLKDVLSYSLACTAPFEKMRHDGMLIEPRVSAQKLLDYLHGAIAHEKESQPLHVDFYDI